MRNLLIMMILLLASGQLSATELPPPFTAHYVVKKGPLQLGVSMRRFEVGEDGTLVYRSSSDTTGLAEMLFSNHEKETTTLQLVDGHALPVQYDYRRSGKRSRTLQQTFDWEKATVASRLDQVLTEYEIDRPTYDLNAYQLNLMVALARGEREFVFNIAGKHGPRTYDIRHVGDEAVRTDLGTLDTVVVQRKSNQTTTLWCAEKLNFLPVRIEHIENGTTFTAYLQSVDGLGE